MSDIIERLRTSRDWSDAIPTMEEAADEIKELRENIQEMDEKLTVALLENERLRAVMWRLVTFAPKTRI